jgi:dUTPase
MTKDGAAFKICVPERDLIPRRGALKIHTGIRIDVPENFVFMATGTPELSGLGILVDACLQPGRFRDLVLTVIGNGTESFFIDRGEDVALGILVPCVPVRTLQLRD